MSKGFELTKSSVVGLTGETKQISTIYGTVTVYQLVCLRDFSLKVQGIRMFIAEGTIGGYLERPDKLYGCSWVSENKIALGDVVLINSMVDSNMTAENLTLKGCLISERLYNENNTESENNDRHEVTIRRYFNDNHQDVTSQVFFNYHDYIRHIKKNGGIDMDIDTYMDKNKSGIIVEKTTVNYNPETPDYDEIIALLYTSNISPHECWMNCRANNINVQISYVELYYKKIQRLRDEITKLSNDEIIDMFYDNNVGIEECYRRIITKYGYDVMSKATVEQYYRKLKTTESL